MNPKTLSAYGALGLPLAMAMLPVYIISPKFYGDTLGVDIAILGVVLFLARFVDTVQDPFIGRLVDYLQPRRHGWTWLILLSAVLLGCGFVLLFAPAVEGRTALLVWLVACLIVVYTAHSMMNVCYLAWGARLTDDVTGRARVTAWREAFGLVGVVLASVVPAVWASSMGPAKGYVVFAWSFVVILAVGVLVTLRFSPRPRVERDPLEIQPLARNPHSQTFSSALSVPAVRRVMFFYLFNAISAAIPATLILFYIDDVLQLPTMAGLFLGVYFLSGLLALPLWVRLSDRIGKKQAWTVGSVIAVLALASAGLLQAGDGLAYALICIAAGLALGADLALPPAMLADAIPVQHRSSTGVYFGVWALIAKLSLAVAAGLALPVLGLLGYQPGTQGAAPLLAMVYAWLPIFFKCCAFAVIRNSTVDSGVHS